MKTPAIFLGDNFLSFTFTDTGKGEIIQSSDPRYNEVEAIIKNKDWQGLQDYFNLGEKVKTYSENNMKIVDGVVYYKDEPVNHSICDKVVHFMKEGLPFQHLLNFLENLLLSDSFVALNELYLFLSSNESMPITEDGAFLAYRVVDKNYMSFHANPDGTRNRNKIGDVVTEKRNRVNPDRNKTCAQGLHFCSKSYIPEYGGWRGPGNCRVMIVKIFPQDVIAIPNDYNNAKGRCCKYEVVGELEDYFNDPKPLTKQLYKSDGVTPVTPSKNDEGDKNVSESTVTSKPEPDNTTEGMVIKIAKLQLEGDKTNTTIRKISKSTKPYVDCSTVFDIVMKSQDLRVTKFEPLSQSVVWMEQD